MTEIKYTIINEWEGGIPSGSLCFNNNTWVVRFQGGNSKTFSIRNCKSLEQAKIKAQEYKKKMSLEKGLTVNRHRLIQCDTDGEYIEIQLNKNHIAKIDKEDLHIALNFKWHTTGEKNPIMKHSANSSESKFFHKRIYPEFKYIYHLNGNTLDNRKSNLSSVSKHTDKIKHPKIVGEWKGGTPQGSIGFYNNAYIVRFNDNTRSSFSLQNYNTLEEAKINANEYRIKKSLEKGLTKNQYRLIECDIEGSYIEMKLQKNYISKFDCNDLELAQKYNSYAHISSHRCYMYQNVNKNDKLLFHRVLYPEYTQVDHINRDGLDNRRKNLRPVSVSENNLNQKINQTYLLT